METDIKKQELTKLWTWLCGATNEPEAFEALLDNFEGRYREVAQYVEERLQTELPERWRWLAPFVDHAAVGDRPPAAAHRRRARRSPRGPRACPATSGRAEAQGVSGEGRSKDTEILGTRPIDGVRGYDELGSESPSGSEGASCTSVRSSPSAHLWCGLPGSPSPNTIPASSSARRRSWFVRWCSRPPLDSNRRIVLSATWLASLSWREDQPSRNRAVTRCSGSSRRTGRIMAGRPGHGQKLAPPRNHLYFIVQIVLIQARVDALLHA